MVWRCFRIPEADLKLILSLPALDMEMLDKVIMRLNFPPANLSKTRSPDERLLFNLCPAAGSWIGSRLASRSRTGDAGWQEFHRKEPVGTGRLYEFLSSCVLSDREGVSYGPEYAFELVVARFPVVGSRAGVDGGGGVRSWIWAMTRLSGTWIM